MRPEKDLLLLCELGPEEGCKSCGTAKGEGCSLIVEVVQPCDTECDVVCCGKTMSTMQAKTEDKGKEKHVPVIEKVDGPLF